MAPADSEGDVMDLASVLNLTSMHLVAMAAGFLTVGYWLGRTSRKPTVAPASAIPAPVSRPVSSGYESPTASSEKPRRRRERLEVDRLAEAYDDFKMVLVVRNDLKMGKGKVAAQCSHATLGLYKDICGKAPKALQRWEVCGQVKVVTRVESEEDLLALKVKAKQSMLPCHITIDAGRTQVAPNSRTVMAVLGPAVLVDNVTGHLKLM